MSTAIYMETPVLLKRVYIYFFFFFSQSLFFMRVDMFTQPLHNWQDTTQDHIFRGIQLLGILLDHLLKKG